LRFDPGRTINRSGFHPGSKDGVNREIDMTDPQTIAFRTFADTALEMDVFPAEKGAGPRPGVLFIHGGGWSAGQRTQFTWHARELAKLGFVTAAASYRLAPAHPYPAALDDCQYAMRWLRAHAAEWNLDPARLGACGSSAGGHLAACLAVRDTRSDDEPALRGFSSRAQCVVDVHGVHDFRTLAPTVLTACNAAFLGGSAAEKPEAWQDASPAAFVDALTAPIMLTHDPNDPTVPYAQSVSFAAALMDAGRPVEFLPTPGSGHGFVYNPENAWTQRLWPRAVAWLSSWLKPEAGA
jgi:acetyl esterase/lipase